MASPITPTHGKLIALYRLRPNGFKGSGLNDMTWGTAAANAATKLKRRTARLCETNVSVSDRLRHSDGPVRHSGRVESVSTLYGPESFSNSVSSSMIA